MLDALFLGILAGFAVLTWALILLCDWLLGGQQ